MSPMSTTLDWILACERQGLLTSADVRRFRQLAEITGEDFSSRVVLKWLTTRDRITAEQAERILSGPPDLSPVELIVRILGDTNDQSGTLELDVTVRASEDYDLEEDTKDLAPFDRESVGELVLPPRGSPAFSGTVVAAKSPPAPSGSAVAASDPIDQSSKPEHFSEVLDEMLADEKGDGVQALLKSAPLESASPESAFSSVQIAAIVTVVVAVAAVIALWIASR